MTFQGILLLTPYLLSAGVSIWLSYHSWRKEYIPGARLFAILALFEAEWTLAYVFQLASPGLQAKLLWNNIQFIGAIGAPLMYLGFAHVYGSNTMQHFRGAWKALIPVAVLLLAVIWTDGLHGFFRTNARVMASEPFSVLVYEDGPAFGVYSVYAYSLISLTTLILVARYMTASRLYRAHIGLITSGVAIPWITSIITALHLIPIELHEITPITFGIGNLFIAAALFQKRIFDVIPVARDYLIENMQDGVIVLDGARRLVDLNPAAESILNRPAREVTGQAVEAVLPVETAWFENTSDEGVSVHEITLSGGRDQAPYEMRTNCLYPIGKQNPVYLLTLHDIRDRVAVEKQLQRLAITDPLTGIYNRRRLFSLIQQEIDRSYRHAKDLAIIIFDVDHFKSVNDSCGHQIGDRVLKEIVKTCLSDLRTFDVFGRYGGEEFIVMLPETNAKGAVLVAERLRESIDALGLECTNGVVRVTISLGVAELADCLLPSVDELIRIADQALYRAKQAGRNCVVAAEKDFAAGANLPVDSDVGAES